MKVVIWPPIDDNRMALFKQQAPDAQWINARSPEEALAAIADADAFLGKISPEILSRAQRLRWIQSFTASLEHYVFPELVAHPCVLTNMRGLFGDVIAEQVLGYILCFARNLHIYIRQQCDRIYEPVGGAAARVDLASGPGEINAMDRATIPLSQANLGVVGCGGIGGAVADRAAAFGMRVRGVDRFPEIASQCAALEHVANVDGLPALLRWADFVVIAAPHTPETERLFDAPLLSHMRATSYLINVGRGAIVALDDLVTALQSGQIAGAALDVFETEPLPAEHPLWKLPNVIITPHTAGYSPLIAQRHFSVLQENVRRFASDQPLLNVVNKALWF